MFNFSQFKRRSAAIMPAFSWRMVCLYKKEKCVCVWSNPWWATSKFYESSSKHRKGKKWVKNISNLTCIFVLTGRLINAEMVIVVILDLMIHSCLNFKILIFFLIFFLIIWNYIALNNNFLLKFLQTCCVTRKLVDFFGQIFLDVQLWKHLPNFTGKVEACLHDNSV